MLILKHAGRRWMVRPLRRRDDDASRIVSLSHRKKVDVFVYLAVNAVYHSAQTMVPEAWQ